MLLVSWKVVKEEQQIQSGLWGRLFFTTQRIDQRVVLSEKSYSVFLLEMSDLLKEFIHLKKKELVSPQTQAILLNQFKKLIKIWTVKRSSILPIQMTTEIKFHSHQKCQLQKTIEETFSFLMKIGILTFIWSMILKS